MIKYNLNKRLKTGPPKSNKKTPAVVLAGETTEQNMIAAKEWLRYGREPWEEVIHQWKASYILRRKEFTSLDGADVCSLWAEDSWPILAQPTGPELMEYDFQQTFACQNTLFQKWPMFIEKIYKLAKKQLKSARHVQMIEEYGAKKNEVLFAHLMCGMLNPGLVKQNFKPSFQDVEKGFVLLVQSENDVINAINKHREHMAEKGVRLQPRVVAVCNDAVSHFYTYIDAGNMQKANSMVHAIDIIFKTCMLIDASYPPEARSVWTFVQTFFYGITTIYDRRFQCVDALCAELTEQTN
ncbi:uncharacterized protein LOC131682518 [Topomyia yanbarensis]|nr:uncharacterized protein LOC131682517 [Topomyia yanbarensis]XP_058820033.1 uncharacterized protein LOC131682518 [Topomyia yanbarensis]